MKRIVILFFVCLVLIFSLASCETNKEKTSDCQYQKEISSNLGSFLWDNIESVDMVELVNKNSVKVYNQNVYTDDYKIQLDEYFYEKNVPFVLYKFLITSRDGKGLTKSQFKELQQSLNNHYLEFYNMELGGHEVKNEMQYGSDGKVIWFVSTLFDAISDQDSVSKITDKPKLSNIIFDYKSDNIGTMDLPDYAYDATSIIFDTSSNDSVAEIKITKYGASIIWNLTDILAEFKKMLKKLPAGENEESYHYVIYNKVTLTLKDGTIYNLYGADINDILDCDKGIREEDNLASYSVLWKEDINLEDISFVTIDGNNYFLADQGN